MHNALADLLAALKLEPKSADIRLAHERCKKLVRESDAREREFGGSLARALEGYHDERHVPPVPPTPEEELSARMAAAGGFGGSGGDEGQQTDGGRQYFENERTIADARLDDNEGNLVMDDKGEVCFKSMMEMGGRGEGYVWGQVRVRMPHGCRARQRAFALYVVRPPELTRGVVLTLLAE